MKTHLTLRKGIVGIIGDDDFNSGFLKLISKMRKIVIVPRQSIQSTNDNALKGAGGQLLAQLSAIKGAGGQLGEQPLEFKTFRKDSRGIIFENIYNLMPVLV